MVLFYKSAADIAILLETGIRPKNGQNGNGNVLLPDCYFYKQGAHSRQFHAIIGHHKRHHQKGKQQGKL